MNKHILNFYDFILYESSKLYENEDENNIKNNTFLVKAQERLKDKVLYHITKNESDAINIVNHSSNLINAAEKVLKNDTDSSNWFTEKIPYIAAGGLTILSIWALMKGKKIRAARLEEKLLRSNLRNYVDDTNILQSSSRNDLKSSFEEFTEYWKVVQNQHKLSVKNSYMLDDLYTRAMKDIESGLITHSDDTALKFSGSENLAKLKAKIIGYQDEIAVIQAGAKPLKGGVTDAIPALFKSSRNLIGIIDDISLKLQNRKLPNVSKDIENFLYTEARSYGLDKAISLLERKQLNSFLNPNVYTAGGVTGIGTSLIMIVRLLQTDFFKDSDEIRSTLNIVQNRNASKEFFAQKIKDNIGSYDKSLGLNLDSIKFIDEQKKQDLPTYISYYLADIIIEQLEQATAYMLYGQISKP